MGTPGRVLERRDVWELSRKDPWHDDIAWYERGIHELQKNGDPADPRSWDYLANIHGTLTPRNQWPPGSTERTWAQCQHATWYFLPWHRIYLHHFEKIVRDAVVRLGGPKTWALPFWNYDPAKPETLALPPAFRQRQTPGGDARRNALYVERRGPGINNGERLDADDVELPPPTLNRFTSVSPRVATFAGPATGWTTWGPGFGELEREPHGLVHVDVGGEEDDDPRTGGLMFFAELAARDPIFWLHHANIDRLWEVWRNQAGHRNTKNRRWLNEPFEMGAGQWRTAMKTRDVLDTTAAPLLYRYEGVPAPEPATVRRELAAAEAQPPDEEVAPELIAASETSIPVAETRIIRPRRQRRALGADAEGRGARRVYLALEDVVVERGAAAKYVVHVNLPEGAHPRDRKDLRAGKISTFGLRHYAEDDAGRDGGATFSFDITEIVERLEADGDWDADDVRVTVTPRQSESRRRAEKALRIGRVGVYYG